MALQLAREEGPSPVPPGPIVVAALRLAGRPAAKVTVVTIICDSPLRYLGTDLFRSSTVVRAPVG